MNDDFFLLVDFFLIFDFFFEFFTFFFLLFSLIDFNIQNTHNPSLGYAVFDLLKLGFRQDFFGFIVR